MYVYTCICTYAWLCVHEYIRVSSCARLHVAALRIRSCDSSSVTGGLNPIRICARYGSDTLAIRKLIHGMIWRFISVNAVETRWQFSSKIAAFHVSIWFCLFPYLSLSTSTCVLLLSFHVTIWDILLVLSFVSLHEILVIIHLICVVDMSFVSESFHVLVNRHCWLRPSIDIL